MGSPETEQVGFSSIQSRKERSCSQPRIRSRISESRARVPAARSVDVRLPDAVNLQLSGRSDGTGCHFGWRRPHQDFQRSHITMNKRGRTDIGETYESWNSSTIARAQGKEKDIAVTTLTRSGQRLKGEEMEDNEKVGLVDDNTKSTDLVLKTHICA